MRTPSFSGFSHQETAAVMAKVQQLQSVKVVIFSNGNEEVICCFIFIDMLL